MTNLTASYKGSSGSVKTLWLILKQEATADDTATIDDAAAVLDAVYDIDPCVDSDAETEDSTSTEVSIALPAIEEEDYWSNVVAALLDTSACAEDGCDVVYLNIYRSHPDRPYKLIVDGGTIGVTTVETKHVKESIGVDGSSFDFSSPVTENLKYSWSTVIGKTGLSVAAEVSADGKSGSVSAAVVGLLRAEYDTQYDRVAISIPREDATTAGSATARCLYAGMVEEVELTPAAVDESVDASASSAICGSGSSGGGTVGDAECYEEVYHDIRCSCDGGDSGQSYTEEVDCSCPDGVDAHGRHLVGRKTVKSYTACAGDGVITAADVTEYEKVCCTPPPQGFPPACDVLLQNYGGNKKPSDDEILSRYGTNVQLIPVGPADGVCGTWTTRWQKPNRNCCDDVVPLVADPENPTEITSGGSRLMKIKAETGNRAKLSDWVWMVSGNLRFANNENTIIGGDEHAVYAPDVVCSNYVVQVNDLCTTVTMQLEGGDTEELSLTRYDDPESYAMGQVYLLVDGGVPGYWLTSGGEHTHFANDERELELESGGVVILYVDKEQICDGEFTVYLSDSCGNVDTLSLDPGKLPIGAGCMRYSTAYFCLQESVGNDDLHLSGTAEYFEYDGLGDPYSYECGYGPEGTSPDLPPTGDWFVMVGSVPALVVISAGSTSSRRTITRYELLNIIWPDDPCEICQ